MQSGWNLWLRAAAAGTLVAGALSTWPLAAASRQAPAPTIRLEVGQAHTFCVAARKLYNRSSICLEAGAHYQFCVSGNDYWYDAKIRCNAGGWTARDTRLIARPIVRAVEPNRRCPAADWFELIGSVRCDGCEYFRIGCRSGRTYTPCRDGQLYAFANDLSSRYHNNSGSICVTVRRVAAPSRCRLPGCSD